MQQRKYLENYMIAPLQIIALIFTALLSSGCATTSRPQDSGAIYQDYDGPRLPPEQIATIDLSYPRVITIDGKEVNKPTTIYIGNEAKDEDIAFSRAELSPGLHTFVVYVRGHSTSAAIAVIQAELLPGHAYGIRSKNIMYGKNSSDYAVNIFDKTSGELVGGRTKEAFDWKWPDIAYMLNEMENEQTTQTDVLELFGVPLELYPAEMRPEMSQKFLKPLYHHPENTLVYVVCKKGEAPITYIKNAEESEECGYLFISFTSSGAFQKYYLVNVPFNECHPNFLYRDALDRSIRYLSCKYHFKTVGHAEYYALSSKPDKAYLAIENGILNAHDNIYNMTSVSESQKGFSDALKKNIDKVTEDLLSSGRALLKKYPDMLTFARKSFTDDAFANSVASHGEQAKNIEKARLTVYQRLVGVAQSQEAELQFNKYFKGS